jgi:AraC-like DNA-binding protein
MLAGLRGAGLDAAAIGAAAGISQAALAPFDGVLPAAAFGRIWEEAFRRAPREELAVEVGLSIPFGSFGPIDYLAASSADVASALASLAAWFRTVATGVSLEIVRDGEGGEVRVLVLASAGDRERRVAEEFTLGAIVGRFRTRALSPPFRASRIRLTRPAPARPTRHAALLGAPVEFGCALAAIAIPAECLASRLPGADPLLQSTLRALAEHLELGAGADDLEHAVRARLRVLLSDGGTDAAAVARSLGMSERTLHRRLRERHRAFGEVLDAFREAEAERLLGADVALAAVAARLGFSDQSAFTRAFRRWKGAPPTAWLGRRGPPAPPPAGGRRRPSPPPRPRSSSQPSRRR